MAVPNVPTSISVSTTGTTYPATQLRIQWSPPSGGDAPTGYDVRFEKTYVSGSTWTTRSSVSSPYNLSGLDPLTAYSVQVRAKNSDGNGNWSSSRFGSTSGESAPGVPTSISVSTTGTTDPADQLRIQWSAPSSGGTPTTYDVRFQKTYASPNPWTTRSNVSSPYNLSGLDASTAYSVQVRARNSSTGSWSSSRFGSTSAETSNVPGIPTSISVNTTGTTDPTTQLRILWSAPSTGGTPTGYDVQYKKTYVSGSTWTTRSSVSSPYLLSSLDSGTAYTIQVRAKNSDGNGTWSSSKFGSTSVSVTLPGIPTSISVNTTGTTNPNTQLRILWSAPSSGGAATGYDVRFQKTYVSGSTWTTRSNVSSPYLLSGLDSGTAYTIQVRAKNSAGNGSWSSSKFGSTTAVVNAPNTPGAPTVTAASSTSLSASWTAPSGGTPTSYDLRYRRSGTTTWTTRTGVTSSYTITGLSASTTYNVQVRAKNSGGTSNWSSSGNGTTSTEVVGTPGTPAAPTVTVVSSTSLRASWVAASTGGTPTSYDLRFRRSGTNSWTTRTSVSSPYTITSLTASTTYNVQVRARNAFGTSGWSSSGTATTSATVVSLPGVPTSITVSTTGTTDPTTQLLIGWSAPSSGGTPTGYDIRYQKTFASPNPWTTVEDVTSSYELSNLDSGFGYTVQVRAKNSAGNGEWSASRYGSTNVSDTDPPTIVDPLDNTLMRISVGVGEETAGEVATENNRTFIGEYYLSGRIQDGRPSFWTNLGPVPIYRETKFFVDIININSWVASSSRVYFCPTDNYRRIELTCRVGEEDQIRDTGTDVFVSLSEDTSFPTDESRWVPGARGVGLPITVTPGQDSKLLFFFENDENEKITDDWVIYGTYRARRLTI